MSKFFLRTIDSLLSLCVGLCLLAVGAYAVYALWDNQHIYAEAENVQSEMLKLKPAAAETVEGRQGTDFSSFDRLRAINGDICAWVSLDDTYVDHPIVWNNDILYYINRDIYGNFALAGSIFLDNRNANDFSDAYSLIYGHHMDQHKMFGDLDLYKDAAFFSQHRSGQLLLPDRSYELDIFACLVVGSSEEAIFYPETWHDDIRGLLSFAEENALHLRGEVLEELRAAPEDAPKTQILALSTCSSEFTDARTVLLAVMRPFDLAQK